MIDGIKNDKLEVVKTQVIAPPTLRQDFTGLFILLSDYINQCEGMNHPVRNLPGVSTGSGPGGRGGRVQGRVDQRGQGLRGEYKGPLPTAKEISAFTHMSDQYFSDRTTNI